MIRTNALRIFTLVALVAWFASEVRAEEKDLQKLLDQGAAALKREDYPAARKAYESATQADMGSIAAWRGLGWAYWELGEQDRAIKVWREALRVRPGDPGLTFGLAVAAEERQQ